MASMPALVKKLPQEGDIRAVEQSMKLSINPSLVMMRECPYSTKTREVLGNPSPPPSRFPSTLEIFALGKSLWSREISWASGMDFSIPPLFWWSTDTGWFKQQLADCNG